MADIKIPTYKSADATLSYGIDWSAEINTDETILTSVWESSDELTITRQDIGGNITSCVISGGLCGKQYKVYNTITTSDEYVDERYFSLKVQDIQVFM